MRITTLLTSTILMFSGILLAQQPSPRRSIPVGRPTHTIGESAPDRLVVQHRLGANPEAIQRLLGEHGAQLQAHHSGRGLSVLRVDPERRDEIQQALDNSGLFDFVEPDYVAQVTATPNDPGYASQWHLATIQAPSAWNITTGSSSVKIAMVDSGVDPTHPDLASKLLPGWSFLTGTSDTHDTSGHGTTTAGAAAALSDNGVGVTGVAWQNPIMPLVVVDSTGYATYSNIANAIMWAADHGARIVNVSIAGSSASSTLQSAVNYAWNKGTVVFASSGNYGTSTPYYPAACQNVVAVGATDSNDVVQSWSNFGSWVSLVAPGLNIYTTTNGGGYGYASGTSYSSPIAAGVGALVLSAAPSLSAASLVSVLEMNADDLGTPGYDLTYAWGRVNAYKAVVGSGTSIDTTPPAVTIASPASGASLQATINVQGTATDNVGVTRIELYVDGTLANTVLSSPYSFAWNTTSAINGSHNLTVKAYDAANNVGTASVLVSVNNPLVISAQAPAVYIQTPTNGATVNGNNLTIAAQVVDTVAISQVAIYVDGVLQYTGSVAPYSFNLNIKKLSRGGHNVTSKAWDVLGLMGTSATVTFYK